MKAIILSIFGLKTIKSTINEIITPRGEEMLKNMEKDFRVKGKGKLEELDKLLRNEVSNIDIKMPFPKDTSESLDEYEEALAETKTENEYLYADWFYKGLSEYDKENYPAAITYWTEALKLESKDNIPYFNRGIAYGKIGQNEEALKDFNKVVELEPEKVSAYMNRGIIYSRLGKNEEALKDYNKVVELEPENVSAILSTAEIGILTGNYEGTIDSVKHALSLPLDISYNAISLYLKCIAEKLLDIATSASENELNEILKVDFTTTWSFEEIELWLKDADIDGDTKEFIIEKTEKLKKNKI